MAMEIHLNASDAAPLYLQVATGIRLKVAAGQLAPGALLPTVRELASQLGVNQNTVLRAYGLLRDEGLLEGRGSLGTRVAQSANAGAVTAARETDLRLLASRYVSEAVSRGYSLDEAEAALLRQRQRWEQQQSPRAAPGNVDMLLGLGSDDLCLELLLAHFRDMHPGVGVRFASVGSLAGLLALTRGEVHFAAAHLYDAAADDYNAPALRELAAGRVFSLMTLSQRTQGFMVPRGNPRGILNAADLARPGVRLVNRQRGSGTRLLLDQLLTRAGLGPESVQGYQREEATHSAVAAAVARGGADVGLGIQAAAITFGLDFVPVAQERYELALAYGDPALDLLRQVVDSAGFRTAASALGGYDLAEAGNVRDTAIAGDRMRARALNELEERES
jgi:molybdate-binding protein/DNA-binding transcriptional regulator YhcF (GntR family)